MGLIENFYEIESKKSAVIRLLQKKIFNFKISQSNPRLSNTLLKINDIFFCNLTNLFVILPVDNIKEKILLIESHIHTEATYYAT
jgi:hypothetical protein